MRPTSAPTISQKRAELTLLADPMAAAKGTHRCALVGCQERYLRGVVTARRRRPFARRALMTLRPLAVAIRLRKPCVRRRDVRLGVDSPFFTAALPLRSARLARRLLELMLCPGNRAGTAQAAPRSLRMAQVIEIDTKEVRRPTRSAPLSGAYSGPA